MSFTKTSAVVLVGALTMAGARHTGAQVVGNWHSDTVEEGAAVFIYRTGFVNDGSVAFVCMKRQRLISVSITPPKELYVNAQDTVAVVATRSGGADTDSLTQHWRNGFQYIFQNDVETVGKLVDWMKESEKRKNDPIGFMFSGAFHGEGSKDERVLLIRVELEGFAQGYAEFEQRCKTLE